VGHDDELQELLEHAARIHGLERYLDPSSFRITTHGDLRRIECEYDQPVEFFPGIRHTFHFTIDVEEPFIVPGAQ
jgi:hypothetical protein